MTLLRALAFFLAGVTAVAAQEPARRAAQAPGEIRKPGEIEKPGEIQQPKGPWLKPGEIQQPKGPWLTPGEIQVPKGIQAVKTTVRRCEQRFSVLADALFDFDKSDLRPDAEETLKAALPALAKATGRVSRVEGHTDGKGSNAYNKPLSEARAVTIRNWLAAGGAIPAATPTKGLGKRFPIAPNTTPDGRDDPAGRQKNRRVDIVFETCEAAR
jgi:outer membrane protein OmpA-like peptidoglycan-associated protein